MHVDADLENFGYLHAYIDNPRVCVDILHEAGVPMDHMLPAIEASHGESPLDLPSSPPTGGDEAHVEIEPLHLSQVDLAEPHVPASPADMSRPATPAVFPNPIVDIEHLVLHSQPAPPAPPSPHHTRSGETFNTTASKVDVVNRGDSSGTPRCDDLAHLRSIRAFKTASEIPLTKAFVGENQEAFRVALAKEQESLKRVLCEVLPADEATR